MITREVVATHTRSAPRDLILKSPPNWTAVVFFAVLSGLHFSIAIPAFYRGHWEGYLSLIFGTLFVTAAAIASRCRFEIAVLPSHRRMRLRTGFGRRFCHERFVPFATVQRVRLTVATGERPTDSVIELICPHEDIQFPPTKIPRQQALFLAMMMGVPLIKVSDEPAPVEPPELHEEILHGRY
jgi:hypothetical protein